MEEGYSHDLFQTLDLKEGTLSAQLALEPKVATLPTDMLCDALLWRLSMTNPYEDRFRLGYTYGDKKRFDFSPPVVDFPFDPGPLTFLFEDFISVELCERVIGGYKWANLAIASFRRLMLWPEDHDISVFRAVWQAFPQEVQRSTRSGYIDYYDLDNLVIETHASLVAKGGTDLGEPLQRGPGMGHVFFAHRMLRIARAGLLDP